ncbi:PDZ domain-containing protein [Acinetobacter vivianii]|uniref:PDZ domain-containing protein n=1 Tax=Acinetobacter vivianii TaxID=1776742 RepID=UPI002DBB3048|nr:PDZ domain-containing protein [Acinetobacter vivianii]MEB6665972.1 PDZ domain-containing protein [Acinetobacter vivianii]
MKNLAGAIFSSVLILCLSTQTSANIYIPISLFKKANKSQFVKAQALKTEEFNVSTIQLLEEGFVPIKSQKFNGRDSSKGYDYIVNELEKRADSLGAQIVLFSNNPSTESVGYYSFLTPAPHSSQNQDENNGNGFGSVNTSNNINGALTQSAPVYQPQKEYTVSYFYRFESITGIYPIDLSDLDKSRTGYLEGVKAKVISKKSPAFGGDIRRRYYFKNE